MNKPEAVYIDDEESLSSFNLDFSASSVLAVDTEFERRTTFYAKLALVQVYDGQTIYLIDPLKVDCPPQLEKALKDPNIVKILHSSKEDLEVIYTTWGIQLSNLFDTQVAYSFINKTLSIGYANIVKELMGDEVDKQQTQSDWTKRPLTDAQKGYAALDVYYLPLLYQKLRKQLENQVYATYFYEECREYTELAFNQLANPPSYRDAKDVWRLTKEELPLFRQLFEWRYQTGKNNNRTLNHIIRDQQLVELVKRRPKAINDIRTISNMHPRSVRLYGELWLKMINQPKQGDAQKNNGTLSFNVIPNPRDVLGLNELTKCLEKWVADKAVELNVLPSLLLSKRLIKKLAFEKLTQNNESSVLQGWRKMVLGEVPLSN